MAWQVATYSPNTPPLPAIENQKPKKSEKKLLPLPPFFHPLHKALERNELCRAFSFALFLFYIFGYKPNKNKQEKRSHLDLQGNTQETPNI